MNAKLKVAGVRNSIPDIFNHETVSKIVDFLESQTSSFGVKGDTITINNAKVDGKSYLLRVDIDRHDWFVDSKTRAVSVKCCVYLNFIKEVEDEG